MNAERRVSNSNQIELEHVVRIGFRYYEGAVILLTAGLILSILAGSLLPVVIVLAAPEEDVPCQVCPEASDPVQYTHLAVRAAKEREAGATNASGLAVGDVSDPVQYTFLAAGAASDPVQYTSLVARVAEDREAGAVRAAGLAVGDASDPVQYAFLAARSAAARGSDCALTDLLARSREAEAARLAGLAEWYVGGEFEVAGAPRLDRARSAEAARLTALAAYRGMGPDGVSPAVVCLAGL